MDKSRVLQRGQPGLLVLTCIMAILWLGPPLEAAQNGQVKITLLRVWASKQDRPAVLSKELKKYEKLLKTRARTKTTIFNSFRLEGKVATKQVKLGETLEQKLSDIYRLKLTPIDKSKLKYQLTKRGARWSELTLKLSKKPYLVILPITTTKGAVKEQLCLILIAELAPKK